MLKPIKVKQKVSTTAAQIQLNCSGMTMEFFLSFRLLIPCDKVRRFFPGTPSLLLASLNLKIDFIEIPAPGFCCRLCLRRTGFSRA